MKISKFFSLMLCLSLASACSASQYTQARQTGYQNDHELRNHVKLCHFAIPQSYGEPVPRSEAVENSYFDDAAFVGDSLTVGMKLTDYVDKDNLFGITGVSIHAIKTQRADFNGKQTTALKAASNMKPKKIYVMLGTNSIGYTSVSTMIEQYAEVIDLLKKSNPNAIFYIQSIPPMTKSYINSNSKFKTTHFEEFNEELEAIAKECYFLDTYSLFVTESGYLPRSLSTDGLHLNQDAYDIMFKYIKTHTVKN